MTEGKTPTDNDIKAGYVRAFCSARNTRRWAHYSAIGERAFNRWLAAHDADVLQRAMAVIAKDTVRKGVFES
jgi:hypothetical protein